MEKNYNYNFENRSKAKKTTVVSGNLLVFSCTASELKKNPVSDGKFWHTTDTNEFYYDWDGKRTKLNFTGDSDSINAEIAKIKADIAKLDPDVVQQKVDTLEGKVNTAVSTVNSLKTDVDSAVSSANSASQAAQAAAAQVTNKVDAKYVDNAIASIELTPGPKGDKGDAFTYDDFTPEQLAALKGVDGKDGQNGKDGADGQNGADGKDGKSAFEIAQENGFVGTETAWLESLKGEGLSQADKDLINSIPGDLSTGLFPESSSVDSPTATSNGFATVQDVMDYVNALIEKKKGELVPSGEVKDYIYVNGVSYTDDNVLPTPGTIYDMNCYEISDVLISDGLKVYVGPEILGFNEGDSTTTIYSEVFSVDVPTGYSIEVHNWDSDNNKWFDAVQPMMSNPKQATKLYGGKTYNCFVRKLDNNFNDALPVNVRYKIIINKNQ